MPKVVSSTPGRAQYLFILFLFFVFYCLFVPKLYTFTIGIYPAEDRIYEKTRLIVYDYLEPSEIG